ncbi:MAG TPA: TolC family protein [Verrucomicrobiae bacterium]
MMLSNLLSGKRSQTQSRTRNRPWLTAGVCLAAVGLVAGCTSKHYAKRADDETYRIIAKKEAAIFGRTNEFTIDTKYSGIDPYELKAQQIISERLEAGDKLLTLPDALEIAAQNSRDYQLQKERLYLTSLTLTGNRYNFGPQFLAQSTGTLGRDSAADTSGRVASTAEGTQLLRTGGRLTATLANGLFKYFTGAPQKEAVTVVSLEFVQPLLRGAWAKVAAENLTQAERNVVYELRTYNQFQKSFAVNIVSSYYRILREKDTVRNQYSNYLRLKVSMERTVALAAAPGRLTPTPTQADLARQSELQARRNYISAVKRYQDVVNDFKITLGLPVGLELKFDDKALDDIRAIGLTPLNFDQVAGYQFAVTNQLEMLNSIDQFEDTQRKIRVAASGLKPGLNFFARADLDSEGNIDYSKFDIDKVRVSTGLNLDLPIDRLLERNVYRTALVNFEARIRTLSLELDDLRRDISEGLRNLDQLARSYEIQKMELQLADRRVEREEMLLEAGRSQIRDLIESQDARIRSQNGVTQTLVDYHIARMNLLLRIGLMKTDIDRFWVADQQLPGHIATAPLSPAVLAAPESMITPDQLFGN